MKTEGRSQASHSSRPSEGADLAFSSDGPGGARGRLGPAVPRTDKLETSTSPTEAPRSPLPCQHGSKFC